ncbi:OLC1v1006007C1 [Oldenlandia corymbosa var. corymbosa]|uniref:OLC1v1006007C1 n=1 Tax=Oldenlandia corymbosa var. corymbosa TaxID=529605 RepID=A0AAV1DGN5_OLDCO|nr:OLC1v1006007C1 [Oldenlandia corymbosa var. corymbosa]
MGTLIGHVAPGFGFFVIGLWHLINHIRLHSLHPKSYTSLPWFPTSKFKYLELFLIMAGCTASVSMELFIGPEKHQPFDPDGTIPSNHLHNFEHSNISLTFFVYALFSIILDKVQPPAKYGLTLFLGAIAFGQQFLLFHLHSADHMGIEGQYHWLLQIVIFVSLFTALLGIGYPKSFLNSFVRSVSIMFQGIWLMVMGFMLWTPELIPKGCFLNLEEGHQVVRCHNNEALERAKSLVNIEFSWYLIGVAIFSMSLYLAIFKLFPAEEKVDYQSLSKFEIQDDDEEDDDVEAQKSINNNKVVVDQPRSFLPVGKSFAAPADMER